MRNNEYQGRTYDACWTLESPDVYRGVFNVESTDSAQSDGVINQKTGETFATLEAAEEAADAAAQAWIDVATGSR
ncbi:MAG: hypothetical protein ACRYGA_09985 [Janthinobacterium lividum]